MPPIRSLTMNASLRTADFESGAKKIQGSLAGIRQSTTQAQSQFSAISTSLLKMGAGITAAALSFQAIKGSLTSVIQAGEQMQRLTLAFQAIAGSSEEARKQMQFVADTSNKLGISTGVLAESYKGLLAASKGTRLEGEGVRDVFTALTQASQTLGLSQEQLQGALVAIQQMLSKGKISAEEWNQQLAERIPQATQVLSRALGVSTADLFKMMEAGSLMADEVLPRWGRQLKSELGQSAETATATASQGLARLGNAMTTLLAGPGQMLSTWIGTLSSGLARVVTDADRAGKALQDIANTRVTSGLAGQGTPLPDSDPRKQQLLRLEAEIAGRRQELNRIVVSLSHGEGGAAFEQLAANHRKAIAVLEGDIATLKKLIAVHESARPRATLGEDIETDLKPFTEAAQKAAGQAGALAKAVRDVGIAAQKERGISFPWEDTIEKVKREQKVLQEGLDKITRGDFGRAPLQGQSADELAALFARNSALEKIVETGKAEKELQKDLIEEQKDYAEVQAQVSEAARRKIDAILSGLTDERDSLRMTTGELELYKLQQAGAGEAVLETAKRIQSQIAAIKDQRQAIEDLAAAEELLFENSGSQKWLEDHQKALEDFGRLQTEMTRDRNKALEEVARRQERIGAEVVTMVEGLTVALKKGGSAWLDFADQVVRQLLRIALSSGDTERKIGQLLEKGLGLLLKAFSVAAPTVDPTIGGDINPDMKPFLTYGRAMGGDVQAHRPVWVGERGPEILVPATSGTVISNSASHAWTHGGNQLALAYGGSSNMSQGGSSATYNTQQQAPTFNIIINATDASSVIRSRSEIARAIGTTVMGTMRSM